MNDTLNLEAENRHLKEQVRSLRLKVKKQRAMIYEYAGRMNEIMLTRGVRQCLQDAGRLPPETKFREVKRSEH